MIDESQIEWLLNGERAEADILNRPLRQLVSATNASLAGVGDVTTEILDTSLEEIREEISTSENNSALLIEKRYNEVFEVTRDGNGFTREKDAQLIFDADNATVSIAPGLGKSTWFYYHKGRKFESSEILTYTLSEADKTDGGFYLSFDKDGNFVNTGSYPDFYNTTLCFYVHYSNGEFIIEGDERHSADRDTAWHSSHHREDGMVVYTLGSIDWTPDDANKVGIQITSTLVADEDLHHLIKHSPTGEEPFSQILEGSQDTVRIPTLYYDGDIRYLTNKKLPWVVDALKYNDDVTLKDVPNGKFINYFLVATHCQKYPIKLIMGRELFDSDHETVDETLESLGLNFPEMALLYRIALKRDNALSTVGKCVITSVQQAASKITFESAAGSGGSGLSNHAQLLGRNDDNAHPISAITGLQDELDSKVDKVSGKELSTNDLTNALKSKIDNLPTGVGGVIPISGGGTGATTAPAARTALGLGAQATRWPTFAEVTNKPIEYDPVAHTHPWDQVLGKPTSFAPSAHTHAWAEVTGQPATATRWPTFAEVTDKPTTYIPSSHTHPWSQVTEQPVTATRWPTWNEVTSKPDFATEYEAQYLSSTTKMLSPKRLSDAFKGGNQSLVYSAGYQKLPGGLILQWGQTSGSDLRTITFPIAFPNACLNVSVNEASITSGGADAVVLSGVAQDSLTRTSFIVRLAIDGMAANSGIFWFAIGY